MTEDMMKEYLMTEDRTTDDRTTEDRTTEDQTTELTMAEGCRMIEIPMSVSPIGKIKK